MKTLLTAIALLFSSSLYAGVCESDYRTTPTDDYAYIYASAKSLTQCVRTSAQNPSENLIFKTMDDGKTIAIVFINKGEIRSTIPQ